MNSSQDHHSVAKAFYQLDCYLRMLNLPFTIKDLYRDAYKEKRGDYFQDAWLDHLAEDPHVLASTDEPFTTSTIAETLIRTGHHPILQELILRIWEKRISFTQAYILGAERRNK